MRNAGFADGVGYDAMFNQPSGIAGDGQGTCYVADAGNGAVRKVVLDTKTVTTLARGLDAPFAVALGDGELFVAERRAVRRVRLDSGEVSTLSASSDGWKQISALAYDPAGLLYISDVDDSRVRAIDIATGHLFDLVGQSGVASVRLTALPGGVNTPSGLALLPTGELAISSSAENAILIAR
jgi:streptogramin lyase